MLQINNGTRYWLYHHGADARLSFDGLSGIVTNELKMELNDVFIFLNKRQTHLKAVQLCKQLHKTSYVNKKIM